MLYMIKIKHLKREMNKKCFRALKKVENFLNHFTKETSYLKT